MIRCYKCEKPLSEVWYSVQVREVHILDEGMRALDSKFSRLCPNCYKSFKLEPILEEPEVY